MRKPPWLLVENFRSRVKTVFQVLLKDKRRY
jgi:hypothetical protein